MEREGTKFRCGQHWYSSFLQVCLLSSFLSSPHPFLASSSGFRTKLAYTLVFKPVSSPYLLYLSYLPPLSPLHPLSIPSPSLLPSPLPLSLSLSSLIFPFRLLSMKTSNGLAIIPRGSGSIATGSFVSVILTGVL